MTLSSAQGRLLTHFLSGLKGANFDIGLPERFGYVMEHSYAFRPENQTLSYKASPDIGEFILPGDAAHPVKTTMWKRKDPQCLIKSASGAIFTDPESAEKTIDFVWHIREGVDKYKDGGDFVLKFKSSTRNSSTSNAPWSFSIIGVEASLLETEDRILYMAPDDGYRERYDYDSSLHSSKNRTWNGLAMKRRYYIRIRDGAITESCG